METRQLTMIDRARTKGMLEAVLFAAGEPVDQKDMAAALELDEETVETLLGEMREAYSGEGHGIRLSGVEGKWQLSTKPDYYPVIGRILSLKQAAGLSQAALETLAIIAYRQPVTRIDIEALRGVSSSSSVQLLLDRELIREAGRKDAPGRPFLYRTTDTFLRAVHLSALEALPSFASFCDEGPHQGMEVVG
jgi:segregation and condensation protein B